MKKDEQAYLFRQSGLKYKEICEKLGISVGHARMLVKSHLRKMQSGGCWTDELTTRARNAMFNNKIESKQQLTTMCESGEILQVIEKAHNAGDKVVDELFEFVGVKNIFKQDVKRCHCCGQIIPNKVK